METGLSIIITTYNRYDLLRRCIQSILEQNYSNYEIIVIDDHSIPSYQEKILIEYPSVTYLYRGKNEGPGPARNLGIEKSINNYVVIMDDDDVFTENAFHKINQFLLTNTTEIYPVFNFLSSNTKPKINQYYYVYSLSDMMEDLIVGDVIHLINKDIFLNQKKYKFPESIIGAESLLWYQVAIDYGFPVIGESIVCVMSDSEERLTNTSRQVKHAHEFAEYQIAIIKQFEEDILLSHNILFLEKKYLGAITYLLLSNEHKQAIYYWKKILNISKKYVLLFPLFYIPNNVLIKLFHLYRKNS